MRLSAPIRTTLKFMKNSFAIAAMHSSLLRTPLDASSRRTGWTDIPLICHSFLARSRNIWSSEYNGNLSARATKREEVEIGPRKSRRSSVTGSFSNSDGTGKVEKDPVTDDLRDFLGPIRSEE